jgi:SRSO17 transposase
VPDDLTCHTKPQLAVDILRAIGQEAMLAFTYMVADGLYGNSPEFIDAAEPGGGKI